MVCLWTLQKPRLLTTGPGQSQTMSQSCIGLVSYVKGVAARYTSCYLCRYGIKEGRKNYSVIEKMHNAFSSLSFRWPLCCTNPLVWLSLQKMQGRLGQWAPGVQLYNFSKWYALLCLPDAVTEVSGCYSLKCFNRWPYDSEVMSYLARAVNQSKKSSSYFHLRFKQWLQIWPWLHIDTMISP